MKSVAEPNFPMLQIVRMLAALTVMSSHWSTPYYADLIPQQQLAVDIFFMAEGFLLAAAATSRPSAPWQEVKSTVLRIYPIYLIGLAIGLASVAPSILEHRSGWSWAFAGEATAFGALMLPTVSPAAGIAAMGAAFPLNWPSWAIVVELFAASAYLLMRNRLSKPVLIGLYTVAAGVFVVLAQLQHDINLGWRLATYWGAVPRVLIGFAGGALLYGAYSRTGPIGLFKAWPLSAALLAGLCMLGWPHGPARAAASLFVGVPTLIVIAASCRAAPWISALGRQADRYVYGVYLLLFPVIVLFDQALDRLPVSPSLRGGPVGWATGLALVLLTAWLATRYVDEPVRRRLAGARLPAVKSSELAI